MINNLQKLNLELPERLDLFLDVVDRIKKCPSQEVKRIQEQIIIQVFASQNPLEVYSKIEDVFLRNNLPYVGKVFKIFDTLHPRRDSNVYSPTLEKAGQRRRKDIIYRDLLFISINSANRSLRDYIEILAEGEDLITRFERKPEELSTDETRRLKLCLMKTKSLFMNSLMENFKVDNRTQENEVDITKEIEGLRTSLEVKEGQSITQRLAEMFVRPLGFTSLSEVEETMRTVRIKAHERSLEYASNGILNIRKGDLIKAVKWEFIENILQNGSLAKEFLGAGANRDGTPLDTDVSMVLEENLQGSNNKERFLSAIANSIAKGYGDLLFVIKNRGQFQHTSKDSIETSDLRVWKSNELFNCGLPQHYGIRTGLPSTEIDFMVVEDDLLTDRKSLEKIYYAVAQNGFYIPITDKEGKIIYTPEMYWGYRHVFDGIEYYEGDPLKIKRVREGDKNYSEVQNLIPQISVDIDRIERVEQIVADKVNKVLRDMGIVIMDEIETGIIGADLQDIGSTGRHTNIPGDADFDMTLLLDERDFDKGRQIENKIIEVLAPEKNLSHGELNGYIQIRAMGVHISGESEADIDIGLTKKTDFQVFGSHDAILAKLDWIKRNLGEETYLEVIANIVLAKQILKKGNAYKRVEHGGFGGIGTENWILANDGNMEQAFLSFWKAAHNGEIIISFEEFKERYKIWNPGLNLKHLYHDNYIDNMTFLGYESMVRTIGEYLGYL